MRTQRSAFTKFSMFGAALVLLFGVAVAHATVVDLTTEDSSGTANGGLFIQTDPRPTGTGVIDPFLRLGTGVDNYEQGYNTSARGDHPDQPLFQYDQKEPLNYTHDLFLSDIPTVTIGGTLYREFLLDINQIKSADGALLSLDVLQIYLRSSAFDSGDITGSGVTTIFPSLGTKIWDLDVGGDGESYIKLNYALNTGSGSGDMLAYIPDSLFSLAGTVNPAVYLFSGFGSNFEANDGFEEWWVGVNGPVPPVPEPGTMILLGAGFLGLAIYGKRRRNT